MSKIGSKIKLIFWDRLEFKIRLNETEEEIIFKGWSAALMREFIINGAAMTTDGPQQLLSAGGRFKISKKTTSKYLTEQVKRGLLKTHVERSVKDSRKKRLIYRSNLHPSQFKYQIIVHEEEE